MKTVAGSGLGIPRSPGGPPSRPRYRSRRSSRTCVRGSRPETCSCTRRPTAPSTVHRRERMDHIGVRRVSPDGRIVGEPPPARTVHLQGGRPPGQPDAAAASEAGADPRGRGAVRGVARLQGSRLDLRQLPEGRDPRRSGRGPATPGGRAPGVAGAAPRPVVRAPGPVGPQLSRAPRRDAAGHVQREVRDRLQELFLRRLLGSSVDYHLSLGESQLARCTSPSTSPSARSRMSPSAS